MDSWAEFWHMGGYAPYVWSAYAIALVVLGLSFAGPIVRRRRIHRMLQRRAASERDPR